MKTAGTVIFTVPVIYNCLACKMDKKLLRISNERPDIGGFFIGVIFLIIALWQGGFSDTAMLVCGASAAACMLIIGKTQRGSLYAIVYARGKFNEAAKHVCFRLMSQGTRVLDHDPDTII